MDGNEEKTTLNLLKSDYWEGRVLPSIENGQGEKKVDPSTAVENKYRVVVEENGDYACFRINQGHLNPDEDDCAEAHIFRKRENLLDHERSLYIIEDDDQREYIDLSSGMKATFCVWHGKRAWSIKSEGKWNLFVDSQEVTNGMEAIDLICPSIDTEEESNEFEFMYDPGGKIPIFALDEEKLITVKCKKHTDGIYVVTPLNPPPLEDEDANQGE